MRQGPDMDQVPVSQQPISPPSIPHLNQDENLQTMPDRDEQVQTQLNQDEQIQTFQNQDEEVQTGANALNVETTQAQPSAPYEEQNIQYINQNQFMEKPSSKRSSNIEN